MIIINNCVLIGRLTRDPDLRYLQTGTAVCKFNLAVDRGLSKEKKQQAEANNQPTTDFINITAWGKLAETIANYTAKGRLIGITGRIQTGSYEKDGQRVYTTEIVASNVDILEWGDKPSQQDNNTNYDFQGFHPTDNDDIPF